MEKVHFMSNGIFLLIFHYWLDPEAPCTLVFKYIAMPDAAPPVTGGGSWRWITQRSASFSSSYGGIEGIFNWHDDEPDSVKGGKIHTGRAIIINKNHGQLKRIQCWMGSCVLGWRSRSEIFHHSSKCPMASLFGTKLLVSLANDPTSCAPSSTFFYLL